MAYTLADLRNILTLSARNARDSTEYSTTRQDFALQFALDEWNRIVKPSKTYSAITLTAGSNVLPSMPSGFLPEFAIELNITIAGQTIEPGIKIVPYNEILKAQAEYLGFGYGEEEVSASSVPTGRPYMLAFQDGTGDGIVYPTPDQAYTINIWWWAQPTTWTAGTGSPTGVTFNVADDALRVVAGQGAVYWLQKNERENADSAEQAHQSFLLNARDFAARGAGGRGVAVVHRSPPDWECGPRYGGSSV